MVYFRDSNPEGAASVKKNSPVRLFFSEAGAKTASVEPGGCEADAIPQGTPIGKSPVIPGIF